MLKSWGKYYIVNNPMQEESVDFQHKDIATDKYCEMNWWKF